MQLDIIPTNLLEEFKSNVQLDAISNVEAKSKENIPFDYFAFYTSVSSVYSSKIEGENIDVDSYFKHKFLDVKYEPDYTKKADDLYQAYAFVESNRLNCKNLLESHKILSQNLLAETHRGKIRQNPMFVLNDQDRIEYVACSPMKVNQEFDKLCSDIRQLISADLDTIDTFYFASMMHLVFLKIHPLQDGNGRTARLLEKWFLIEKFGQIAISIELEKNYYNKKPSYYDNIRKIGLEYDFLDYSKSLDFLLMTVNFVNQVD